MKKNIKKIIAVLVVFVAFIGYVLSQKSPVTVSSVDTNSSSSNTGSTGSTGSGTKPSKNISGKFSDGTYSGGVVDAYYGNVQVQAIIKNGVLADVVFLQHPSDRNTSIRINNMAMPKLKSEAIKAQSAQVDAVSGASETSRAFVQSLQSALNQAQG